MVGSPARQTILFTSYIQAFVDNWHGEMKSVDMQRLVLVGENPHPKQRGAYTWQQTVRILEQKDNIKKHTNVAKGRRAS